MNLFIWSSATLLLVEKEVLFEVSVGGEGAWFLGVCSRRQVHESTYYFILKQREKATRVLYIYELESLCTSNRIIRYGI